MTFFFFLKTFVLGLGPLSDQRPPRSAASPVQGRQSKDASPRVYMSQDETHPHTDEEIVRAIYHTTFKYDVVFNRREDDGNIKVFKRPTLPTDLRGLDLVRNLWKKLSRTNIEDEIEWMVDSCRTVGVKHGIYFAAVVCSSKWWLWRTHNKVLGSFGWNKDAKEVMTLEQVCTELLETLLKVKNSWFNEFRKMADAYPDVVCNGPLPLKALDIPL